VYKRRICICHNLNISQHCQIRSTRRKNGYRHPHCIWGYVFHQYRHKHFRYSGRNQALAYTCLLQQRLLSLYEIGSVYYIRNIVKSFSRRNVIQWVIFFPFVAVVAVMTLRNLYLNNVKVYFYTQNYFKQIIVWAYAFIPILPN